MKITKISAQRKKQRYNIYVDDSFSLGIHEDVLVKYNLHVGMEVSDSFLQDVLMAEELSKTINYCLNRLSYRARSEKELRVSMDQKGYTESNIEDAIAYLKEHGYIDDLAFAKAFINDKLNLNKYGPKRIQYELTLKGVSKDIIDQALVVDRDEQLDMARKLANKKMSSYKNDTKKDLYRKLGGFLQRKGFTYDVVAKVVREKIEEIDDYEKF